MVLYSTHTIFIFFCIIHTSALLSIHTLHDLAHLLLIAFVLVGLAQVINNHGYLYIACVPPLVTLFSLVLQLG